MVKGQYIRPRSVLNYFDILNKCKGPTSNTRNNPRSKHRPGHIGRMFAQRNDNNNGDNT